jgi:hypothetical protein
MRHRSISQSHSSVYVVVKLAADMFTSRLKELTKDRKRMPSVMDLVLNSDLCTILHLC